MQFLMYTSLTKGYKARNTSYTGRPAQQSVCNAVTSHFRLQNLRNLSFCYKAVASIAIASASALLRSLRNTRICMGGGTIVPITGYECEGIEVKIGLNTI